MYQIQQFTAFINTPRHTRYLMRGRGAPSAQVSAPLFLLVCTTRKCLATMSVSVCCTRWDEPRCLAQCGLQSVKGWLCLRSRVSSLGDEQVFFLFLFLTVRGVGMRGWSDLSGFGDLLGSLG